MQAPARDIINNRLIKCDMHYEHLRGRTWISSIYFTKPWAGIRVRYSLHGDLWIIAKRGRHQHVFITCSKPFIWISSVSKPDHCCYVNENHIMLIQPIAATFEVLQAERIMTIH